MCDICKNQNKINKNHRVCLKNISKKTNSYHVKLSLGLRLSTL